VGVFCEHSVFLLCWLQKMAAATTSSIGEDDDVRLNV